MRRVRLSFANTQVEFIDRERGGLRRIKDLAEGGVWHCPGSFMALRVVARRLGLSNPWSCLGIWGGLRLFT